MEAVDFLRHRLAELDQRVGQVLEQRAIVAQDAEHRLEPILRLLATGLLARIGHVAVAGELHAVALGKILATLPEELAVAIVRLAMAGVIELVVAAALARLDPHHARPPPVSSACTMVSSALVIAA